MRPPLKGEKDRYNKIDAMMNIMGFEQKAFGSGYTHPSLPDVTFDVSTSAEDTNSIMSHIFKAVIEEGKKQKLLEICRALNLYPVAQG